MQRVANFLGCAANTASELVSRLVSKKLVEKQRSEVDERAVFLRLTDVGRTALDEHVGLDVARLAKALEMCDLQARHEIHAAFEALLDLVGKLK